MRTIALLLMLSTMVSAETGFTSLIDDPSLDQWTGDKDAYEVRDGYVASDPKKAGKLFSKEEYDDFVLRFEYRLTPGANNGIGIRVPEGGHASMQGMEIQILDDTHKKYDNLKPYQANGSVYCYVPAEKGHLKPLGEWNEMEIRYEGSHAKITLNGHVIVDADLEGLKPLDGRERPGINSKSGHLTFCGHRSEVHFRNMRVKKLGD